MTIKHYLEKLKSGFCYESLGKLLMLMNTERSVSLRSKLHAAAFSSRDVSKTLLVKHATDLVFEFYKDEVE